MRSAWIAVAFSFGAIGAVLGGCMIVTGGTSDYVGIDAGPREGGVEAAACPFEAGSCVQLNCNSAADCNADGGAPLCCINFQLSPLAAEFTCQASCLAPTFQSCQPSTNECGDAATCNPHTCDVNGVSLAFSTCGQNPCSLGQ